ncbi:MAG: Hsp33 family molecular chaperone [Alphaproteobacteria bacterium]|nr:Hsp33 family molecular chaperone [Alphaproteobacteria bacterium]
MTQEAPGAHADDTIRPFAIEGADVRGRIVRLGPVVDQVLRRHDYPEAVSRLLGEALTLVILLGNSLKFRGTLSLQTKGDGPVPMLIADYLAADDTHAGRVRGYAVYNKNVNFSGNEQNFSQLSGKGYFALTMDPGAGAERYQGIVALEGDSLANCAEKYFLTSEQIPTAIRLSVGRSYLRGATRHAPAESAGVWRSAGMLIQHLPKNAMAMRAPEDPAEEHENWRRSRILMQSVTDAELIDPLLANERLLYRLFHEEGVRVFPGQTVAFGCRCTRDRLAGVLLQYSRPVLEELLEDGYISGSCEFCNETYRFTLDELASPFQSS